MIATILKKVVLQKENLRIKGRIPRKWRKKEQYWELVIYLCV